MDKKLNDIPAGHRAMMTDRAADAARQLQVIADALGDKKSTLRVATAYDSLCFIQRRLDELAVGIARYGD